MNLDAIAHVATIVASVVAVAALIGGLWQFTLTQEATREAKAIDLYLRFNEINETLPEFATTQDTPDKFWRRNALVTITESVFRLTAPDPGWRETIEWMIQVQRPFLTSTRLNSRTYSQPFIRVMKTAIPELRFT